MAKKSNKTEQVLKLITKDGEEEIEEVEEMEAMEEAAEPAPVPEPVIDSTPKPEPESKPVVRAEPEPATKSGIIEEEGFLVNLTEMLVKEKADEIMDRLNVCKCSKCKYDVLALTLNSLTNKFVTSNTGRLHIQLEVYKKQSETDIVAALTRASVRVKGSPHHD